MDESFNPYLKWLAIPLEDQPPNHYQLLGVPELIDDADIIENAANRQMGHIRTFATGKHSRLSQQLLNELAAAKICLLSPAKKQAYDEQLRQATARQAALSPPAPPPAAGQPVLQTSPWAQAAAMDPSQSVPVLAAAQSESVTERVKKRNSAGLQVAVVLGLLLLAGIAMWGLSRSPSEPPVVAEQESVVLTPDSPPVETATVSNEDETPDDPPATSEPDPSAESNEERVPSPTGTTKQGAPPDDSQVEVNEEGAANDNGNLGDSSNNRVTGKAVDLLKQIDLKRDAVVGNWTLDEGAIISPVENEHSRLMLPAVVPNEYVLEMDVERIAGDNMLFVGLLVGGKQIELLLDYHPPNQRVHISGVGPNGIAPYYHDPIFESGRPSRIRCEVTSGQVKASVNGKTVLDVRERLDELTMPDSWAIPKRDVLFLGSHRSGFRFTKIELTPIVDDNAAIAKGGEKPSTGKTVDLLKQIDLARDVVDGAWTLDDSKLVSPAASDYARLSLPIVIPPEYSLDMEVERISGDNMLCILLVVAGKPAELFFDYHRAEEQPFSGFIPQERFPIHRGSLFPQGRPRRLECRVTKGRVEVLVDGKTVFDQRERLGEMTLIGGWAGPNLNAIILGSQRASFRFTKLVFTPLDGSAGKTEASPDTPTPNDDLPVVKKLPLPAGPELETAQTTLREIFAAELAAAKSSEQQSALAKTFLSQVTGDRQSPAETFVLLRAAKTMAIKGAGPETALAAVDKIGERFEIDPLEMKAETLTHLAKSAKKSAEQMALILAIGQVVRELVEVDRFDEAEPLTKLAQSAALQTRNVTLRKELAVSVKEFGELQKAYRIAQPALEKLQESPDDAEANLEVGRYRAFIKGDWPQGLKNLAAGSNETLRSVASQDLAGADDSAAQVKLGDAWWEAAKAEAVSFQKGPKLRAGRWYGLALPELSGLSKEHVSRRLDEIRELNPVGRIERDDWTLWTWDGRRYQDTAAAKILFDGGTLSLANKTNLKDALLLVYQPFVSNGPFLATVEIKGQVHQIGLSSVDRSAGGIVAYATTDQQWHTITFERSADRTVIVKIDGNRVDVRYWYSDRNLEGKIAFWLLKGEGCTIRRFEVQPVSGQPASGQ